MMLCELHCDPNRISIARFHSVDRNTFCLVLAQRFVVYFRATSRINIPWSILGYSHDGFAYLYNALMLKYHSSQQHFITDKLWQYSEVAHKRTDMVLLQMATVTQQLHCQPILHSHHSNTQLSSIQLH